MDSIHNFVEERYQNSSMENTDYSLERLHQTIEWIPEHGSLLEIGVWDGSIVKHYRPKFKGKIAGTDLKIEIMKDALHLLDEAKACDLNTQSLPWDKESFDIVVCNEIIEHLFDTDRLLEDINRVLKPNGLLILSTPNLASLPNRLSLLLGWQPFGTEVSSRKSNYGNPIRKSLNPAGHIRVFTYKALIDILNANNFSIIKKKSTPISNQVLFKFVEKVASFISPSLGSDMVFLCKKSTGL